MAMYLTLRRLQQAFVVLSVLFLVGCAKKSDEIRFSNQNAPKKFSSYVTDDGKVVRKWAEYRPVHKMSYEELAHEKKLLEIKKDYHLLIMYLEQLIKVCPNQDELAAYRLQLADIHFMQEAYDKAKDNYDAYADLYPGSPFSDYALYRSVVSRHKILLTPDRDQALTKALVTRARSYLKQQGKKLEYADQVGQILDEALYRLFTAEVITFYFYLNNSMLKAAQQRLDFIKGHNLKDLPRVSAEVAVLEYELAIAANDIQRADKTKKIIDQKLKQKKNTLSAERQKRLERADKHYKSLALKKEATTDAPGLSAAGLEKTTSSATQALPETSKADAAKGPEEVW